MNARDAFAANLSRMSSSLADFQRALADDIARVYGLAPDELGFDLRSRDEIRADVGLDAVDAYIEPEYTVVEETRAVVPVNPMPRSKPHAR